jgi:hypothetical protein
MSEKKQKLTLAITVLFTIALSIIVVTLNPAESAEACCDAYDTYVDPYILRNFDLNSSYFVDHYSKYNYYDSNSFGSSYSTYVWNYDWLNLFTPDLWFPNSWSNTNLLE